MPFYGARIPEGGANPAEDNSRSLLGAPTPAPLTQTAAPTGATLATAPPILTAVPTPGSPVVLDLTGKLNAQIPVSGAELAYIEMVSNATVSATTEATANQLITDVGRAYDGTPILIEFFCPVVQVTANTSGNFCIVALYDGSNSIGLMGDAGTTANVYLEDEFRLSRRMIPTTGVHTYSIRSYRTNANCTAAAGDGSGAGHYMPAYLRITRV